jgi:hypothetical protein
MELLKKCWKESWEREAHKYHERLTGIRQWSPDVSYLVKRLPDVPLNYKPSPEGLVAINQSLYVLESMGVANQATVAFLRLWEEGLLATISLPARLIYELWGATHFACQTLGQMRDSGNIDRAAERAKRLTLGVRSEVRLPWGGTITKKDISAINVMDLVRSLADSYPQAENDYNFLCESCHPSHLRLVTWLLSGPKIGNWENEKYREEVHGLIDHTIGTTERALAGIAAKVIETLELAWPYVEADKLHGHT